MLTTLCTDAALSFGYPECRMHSEYDGNAYTYANTQQKIRDHVDAKTYAQRSEQLATFIASGIFAADLAEMSRARRR